MIYNKLLQIIKCIFGAKSYIVPNLPKLLL